MAVYFVQAIDGGSVKIGHSADVPARLAQPEAHYGRPFALLATLPGGRQEEREIHERFAEHRLGRTEQFRPVAEIMAFIGRPLLVGADPDAVEVMESTDDRRAIVNLVGSHAYAEWLDRFHQETRLPKATLFRWAMAEFAKTKGQPAPPEI